MLEKYGLAQAKVVNIPSDVDVVLKKEDGSSRVVDSAPYQSLVGSTLYCAIAT